VVDANDAAAEQAVQVVSQCNNTRLKPDQTIREKILRPLFSKGRKEKCEERPENPPKILHLRAALPHCPSLLLS
jgi:hypothetical protein